MPNANKSDFVPSWEKKLVAVLRVLILASGLYQVLFVGDMVFGTLILISWSLIVLPGFFTRNFIRTIPIEIEIVLFLIVIIQFILGHVHDFYTTIPYYDKFVHYMLPFFIGFIGFMLIFTMYATGKLKASIKFMVILIILVSLGIGAFWEIFEYSSDVFIYPHREGWPHFQGNNEQDALNDTMTDLIIDTLGGVFGAIMGVWFIGRLENQNVQRLDAFTKEIASNFVGKDSKPQKKKTGK